MEKAGIRETTEEISKNQKEGTNLKVQHKADTKAYEQELQRDKELTPPFKTDTIKDGLTVFRFGNPNLTPLYFTFNTKDAENIMIGHFTPMSEVPRRPKNEYSKTLITAFNKLLQKKRSANSKINHLNTTIIYDNEFNDFIMSVMSDVTIDTIISTLKQIDLNSPLPTPSASPSASPPSSNDLDIVDSSQINIMDKLQKSISRFNQFIQMSLSQSKYSYIVKRDQYEAVVLAMWNKIYELNRLPSKTEPQLNLIRTLLSMLLSVIQTWAIKHTGEPMTLAMSKEIGDKTPVSFLIEDKQWTPVTNSITGLEQYVDLMKNITNERKCFKGSCSIMGGRKSRKARKVRRTRKSRKAKRRTRRTRK